ncbi:ABC transporter permease [Parapedobacter indicus]|uniref:ABC-2 type transport system permease protein n=1 Tax=Parapedobacter indicus TaxID=1477437 RepID=A0A1I3IHX3_9SPHI|nr:ABC transporter permease [Parapedobacter indicus]PPL02177.1 ABC-2 type transport system permease protein [Parapedobacter indicus]SFI47584.1 ABC-2 type transport system permease protein [Parapedobacter indicus]
MNKILLIIKREYLSRVKKRSFLLVTFLVPLVIIGIYALTIYLTARSFENNKATVHVVDQSGLFAGKIESTKNITFIPVKTAENTADERAHMLDGEGKNFLLIIPPDITTSSHAELIAKETASLTIQGDISRQLENVLRDIAFANAGIDRATVENIRPEVTISAKEITDEGEKDSSAGAAMGIAMSLSIVVYICLFLYGSQVMRGVIEEKNSRIVEVIISSVKPFQLMMGKIVGIGLVGLTQFILWIILSTTLVGVASAGLVDGEDIKTQIEQQQALSNGETQLAKPQMGMFGTVKQELNKVDFQAIITTFLLYFFGGYLLYSALFAAVGSAVDSETETQQFMFPITIPLLFTYILSFGVLVNDPNGPLAFWLSMIPFTSPIAMLVRIPFGVPGWQIGLSLLLLIGGFIFTTWVAARIYRVGILMYGKKASYKELVKWLRYKN